MDSPDVRRFVDTRRLGDFARRSARLLARWAGSLEPITPPQGQVIHFGELMKLPNLGRLNFDALSDGRIEVQYGALDAIWIERDDASGIIDLREHAIRLCMVADELAAGSSGSWRAVSENLMLAASLRDLSADTDLQNTSMMCGSAAEYGDVNSQLAEKHLAGVIVSNLVWTAYECAVEAVADEGEKRRPKGALGRDLILRTFGDRPFPHLKPTVLRALTYAKSPPGLGSPEAKRALAAGAWGALGAEHLRQFRNRMVHGEVRKPEPRDWGDGSSYVINNDPAILQFEANVRLLLLLIQILALQAIAPEEWLFGWKSDADPAHVLLEQLHCVVEEGDQLDLRWTAPRTGHRAAGSP
jgi:hypothetical protein